MAERAERVAVNCLAPGDSIKGGIYKLKSVTKSSSGGYDLILADKTAEIKGFIAPERWVDKYREFIGGAVTIFAVVYVGTDNEPLVKVKSMESAPSEGYKPSDLFDGLSPQKVAEYKKTIRELTARIPSKAMQALVNSMLTEERLNVLAKMPASLAYQGRYLGGALAETAASASIVTKAAVAYTKQSNGLYNYKFDWSTLCGAALLHMCAIPEFYTAEQPFKMTEKGVQRGYMSLMQDEIEVAIKTNSITLSDEQVSKLINVLSASVPRKTGIRATCPEGKAFRLILQFYEEMDQAAAVLAEYDFKEGESYAYLSTIGYMTARQGEMEADAA